MSGDGRQVWLRRVPGTEASPRGLGWAVRRLARRAPRPAYDVEIWDGGRLTHVRRTPRPARVLVRRGEVAREDAGDVVRDADATPADWVTVRQ